MSKNKLNKIQTVATQEAAQLSGGKNENKNIQAPLGHEFNPHKMTNEQEIQAALGKQKNHDWDHYLRMPEYEGMELFGCLQKDTDRWFSFGAEPVKRQSKARKVIPGINDGKDSEYESIVSGVDAFGNPEKTFLLYIPKEEYLRLKIQPQRNINLKVKQSYGIGRLNNDGEAVLPGVKGIQTYAPNTGDGNTGYSETVSVGEPRFDV